MWLRQTTSCTRRGAHSAPVGSLPLAKNAVHSPSSNYINRPLKRLGCLAPARQLFRALDATILRDSKYRKIPLFSPRARNGRSSSTSTNPVTPEPSKQPTEVSTLIQTVGFKLIQDSGLQIAISRSATHPAPRVFRPSRVYVCTRVYTRFSRATADIASYPGSFRGREKSLVHTVCACA